MFFRKKSTPGPGAARGDTKPSDQSAKPPGTPGVKVSANETAAAIKPVRRTFPGPRQANLPLRVAMERKAYGELVAHAKESLEVEVCGVLAGQICEDEEGLFVHVEAVIRGAAASQASTHVTFTQSTWNSIHQILEKDFPKLRIVGWYHTHPGFGVDFSEMDLFIQNNFFSGQAQIALVTDPLSGAVAICFSGAKGIEYLGKFWVDGREQTCRVPAGKAAPGPGITSEGAGSDTATALQALEARVSQLVQALDEQRASFGRFLTFVGIVFCLGVLAMVGYFIYSQFVYRNTPPKLSSWLPIPVQVGDKNVLLGINVAEWQLPPELNSMYVKQMEKIRQEMEKAAKEAEAKGAKASAETGPTNSLSPSSNTPPQPQPSPQPSHGPK